MLSTVHKTYLLEWDVINDKFLFYNVKCLFFGSQSTATTILEYNTAFIVFFPFSNRRSDRNRACSLYGDGCDDAHRSRDHQCDAGNGGGGGPNDGDDLRKSHHRLRRKRNHHRLIRSRDDDTAQSHARGRGRGHDG